MEVLSLGWRTDLALLRLAGSEVEHRPTYAVVRTPANPTYRWGNFVLLRRTPLRRDVAHLDDLYARELPGLGHRAFGVDDPEADGAAVRVFSEGGYDVHSSRVLTARTVQPPPHPNDSTELRQLAGDDDWEQRVTLDLACQEGGGAGFEEFTRRRARAERGLTQAGHGGWFGAFDHGRLVASLGIVRAGAGLARFQEVQTHPEARGRGIAGALVHAAGQHALASFGVDTLVIVADPDHRAIRIYRSVGFTETESQLQAEWTP